MHLRVVIKKDLNCYRSFLDGGYKAMQIDIGRLPLDKAPDL
ncbi:hypothetical protein SNE25_08445 [Mucilaginibacter sabulilitoris]|uniref:Uncharacterized protein n=1 Tax=Mucilaginibacter sabulilitoris TaxID=1173583 RepID=A0ABZ0TQY5_9SPHI|nr:hypothetical protein [Mucilaginibacter sabulilitoris]WPU95550.1 hypothetical protein SNE25_08445 [Mucilaginibacter sabulilitoris]